METVDAATIVLSDEEREAVSMASDKCFMEAERLVELPAKKKDSPGGRARLVADWLQRGDVLANLYARSVPQ